MSKKTIPSQVTAELQNFHDNIRKFGTTVAKVNMRLRNMRLNRKGISTDYAPPPFHGTDI